MSKENAYQVLNIEKNSTQETIKTSYKKLARQWHPDKNSADNAKEMFQKISVAYKTLFREESENLAKLKSGLSFEDNLKIQIKIDEIIKITHQIDDLIRANNDFISQSFMNTIQAQKLNLHDKKIKQIFKNRNIDATKALHEQSKLYNNIKKEILKNKSFTATNHTFIIDYNNDRYNSLQNEESYNNHLERDFHNVAKLPLCHIASHDLSFESITKEIALNEDAMIAENLNSVTEATNVYKTIACLGFNYVYSAVEKREKSTPADKQIKSNVIDTWLKAHKKNLDIDQKRSILVDNYNNAYANNIPKRLMSIKKDLISEHNEVKKIVKNRLENEYLLSVQINEKNKWAGRAVGTVTTISLLAAAGYIYSQHR